MLFGFSAFFQNAARYAFGFAGVLYLLWILIKINGAIALAATLTAIEAGTAREIARRSYNEAIRFFRNGLATGVLFLFGQILLVCPCFLFLNNFLFSPYLIVYEGVSGKAAKLRSKELAAGASWRILNRTAMLMLAGYAFLILMAMLLFTKLFWPAAAVILLSTIYFSLVQSNYIRAVYEYALELRQTNTVEIPASRYKLVTLVSILFLVLVYLGIKISPYFATKIK